tara:strand:+ start:82353 stop:83345 length:993 start_codon:yes stop_codon:yes gene_type:complete
MKKKSEPGIVRGCYAAIDLGTNNCRMIIAINREDSLEIVASYSRIVRLGEGLAETGVLSHAAMDRTIEALSICANRIKKIGVDKICAVATDACRRAENADIFLSRIKSETGLDFEIITPEKEAGYALIGCSPLIDTTSERSIIFDIGGGSTEIIIVDSRSLNLDRCISMGLGVVGLTEKYGGNFLSEEDFESMVYEVSIPVREFMITLERDGIEINSQVQLIGTSGTLTTLGGVYLNLDRYDRDRVDGLNISIKDIEIMIRRLLSMGYAERSAIPCVGEGRGDVVLAGCAILKAIISMIPVQKLIVADRGLREGILQEMIKNNGRYKALV